MTSYVLVMKKEAREEATVGIADLKSRLAC